MVFTEPGGRRKVTLSVDESLGLENPHLFLGRGNERFGEPRRELERGGRADAALRERSILGDARRWPHARADD